MDYKLPMYWNELDRILSLSDYDLDYSDLNSSFQNLSKLAAEIAGTEISLINLIDTHTQWTVSNHGLQLDQMPREDSVCQYTINSDEQFEVKNLSQDERFKEKFYVTGELGLRYYFGLPLKTTTGQNIGALCVLDTEEKNLSSEKIALLKIVADEIVTQLKTHKLIDAMKAKIIQLQDSQNRVIENVISPLTGITGVTELILEQGKENEYEDVLELVTMVHSSGKSMIEDLNEAIILEKQQAEGSVLSNQFTLPLLKVKLLQLYQPQAKNKRVGYNIEVNTITDKIPFTKDKLLQVFGNLIANSLKFSPEGGKVTVHLDLKLHLPQNMLKLILRDNCAELSPEFTYSLQNTPISGISEGNRKQGYEFGLAVAYHFVKELNGSMKIISTPGEENHIEIDLPRE